MSLRLPLVFGHYLQLRKEEWMDVDSIERMQKARLRDIMSHAYSTKHYREKMDGEGLSPSDAAEDISSMPLLERDDLYDDSASFVSRGKNTASMMRLETAGSSGKPIEVFIDRESHEFRMAMSLLSSDMMGITPFDITAIISRYKVEQSPLLYRLGLFRKVSLPIFADDDEILRRLKQEKVTILNTLQSCAAVLASLNNMRGRPLSFKRVVCSGEMFGKGWKDSIREFFSCPVFDIYGSTEFHIMAQECPEEHSMHVLSSACMLEILDKKGKPVRSGKGEIVATSLHNKEMPLIRYRIGDYAEWGKPCSCGRHTPVLKSIDGSKEDLVVLPSGRCRSATSIRPTVGLNYIKEFQIVQERPELFVIRYVPAKNPMTDELRRDIAGTIRRGCLGEEVTIEFEETRKLVRGRSGKLKLFESKVEPKLFS
jgi:phenylacetate-CoA ligase